MLLYNIYKCFGMYNRMFEETKSSPIEIIKVIENHAIVNNIAIIEFIFDYKKIQYTEDNICKYLDFVLLLDYDRTNEYIDYIIDEYIMKCKLLEQINHFEIIKDKIKNICSKENKLTDDILLYLNEHIKITQLNAIKNENITDESVKYLINLTSLNANYSCKYPIINNKITDESVKCLINLTKLYASNNSKITDESVKHLTNLTSLDARFNDKITDDSVKCLTNLTSLCAYGNRKITDESVKCLINLTSLYASFNNIITDESVKYLINLTLYVHMVIEK